MIKKRIVIIGGGTAGLVIAECLADNFDVIVLEKSSYKPPLFNRIPLMIGLLYRGKILKYIKKYNIVVHEGRSIPFFESCVLGGASVVNGCVHALGTKYNWDKQLSRFLLAYEKCPCIQLIIYR